MSSPSSQTQQVPATAPNPPKRTSLKKGAMLNWLSLGIFFVSAFVLTPIIIHRLGKAGYGTWALIQSFAGYYGLVNMGLGSALLRSITHDLARREMDSLQTTISTAIRFFASSGAVIMALAAILGLPAARFFNLPAEEASWFALTVFLAAASIVTDFFGAVTTSFLNAGERFDWLNGLNIGRQLVQTTATLLVLWFHPSMVGIAAVMLGTSLLAQMISSRLARKIAPEIKYLKKGFQFSRLKELLSYGGGTVMLTVSNIVRLRLGNLIIAKFSGVAAVASYSIAVALVTNFSSILSSSMGVLNSRFTRLNAQSKQAELSRLYRTTLFASATMAFGLGTGMLLFGESFIGFWVGKSLPESVPVLQILVLAYMVALAQSPSWNLMFAISKHHYMARVSIFETVINIVLGLWLSHLYGPVGFAWATASTMLASKILIQPAYSARIGGISLSEYLSPMAYPFVCAAILWFAAYWGGLGAALRNHGIVFFLSAGCVYVIVYAGLVGLLVRRQAYVPPFLARYLSPA